MPKVSLPRTKSCSQCRAAKTRCDLTRPRCSRCDTKGLDCYYTNPPNHHPSSNPRANQSSSSIGDEASPSSTTVPTAGNLSIEEPQLHQIAVEDMEEARAPEATSEEFDAALDSAMDWDLSIISTGDVHSLTQADTQSIQTIKAQSSVSLAAVEKAPDINPSWLQPFSSQSFDLDDDVQSLTTPHGSANAPDPPGLTIVSRDSPSPTLYPSLSIAQPELLARKKSVTVGSWLTARTILGIITSFPKMMLGDSPLPPFIHPLTPTNSLHHECVRPPAKSHLPEPLAITTSILQMHTNAQPTSIPFILRTIQAEQQRLHSQRFTHSKWDLLSAMQACTIYLILTVFDCQTSTTSAYHARILLSSITDFIATLYDHGYCGGTTITQGQPQNQDLFSAWHDWIWEESCNRCIALLHIIGVLVNISEGKAAHPACVSFDGVPLPAGREMFEATTRADWETRFVKEQAGRSSAGELKLGMLREMRWMKKETGEGGAVGDLGRWCDGVDVFGQLVLMAAMMIEKT